MFIGIRYKTPSHRILERQMETESPTQHTYIDITTLNISCFVGFFVPLMMFSEIRLNDTSKPLTILFWEPNNTFLTHLEFYRPPSR